VSDLKQLTPEEKRASEIREQLAAIAARRAEREAARAKAEEIPNLERELRDTEALEKADAELGPEGKAMAVVRTDLGAVIVKRATPPAFKRFQDLMARENPKQHELSDQLVRPCLVHPDPSTFDRMLTEQPHILLRCANAISSLAGVRQNEVAGK
jgi:hypothetical protein